MYSHSVGAPVVVCLLFSLRREHIARIRPTGEQREVERNEMAAEKEDGKKIINGFVWIAANPSQALASRISEDGERAAEKEEKEMDAERDANQLMSGNNGRGERARESDAENAMHIECRYLSRFTEK